eukprot:m.61439 g.61439  ORF g.61439 m.61439 type:complete len:61 (-) comp7337_c1_seq1:856-1038(-)
MPLAIPSPPACSSVQACNFKRECSTVALSYFGFELALVSSFCFLFMSICFFAFFFSAVPT